MARVGDSSKAAEPPGTLDYRLYAATADGYLEILEVRPQAGKVMPFTDFTNGRHVRQGDKLIPIDYD